MILLHCRWAFLSLHTYFCHEANVVVEAHEDLRGVKGRSIATTCYHIFASQVAHYHVYLATDSIGGDAQAISLVFFSIIIMIMITIIIIIRERFLYLPGFSYFYVCCYYYHYYYYY